MLDPELDLAEDAFAGGSQRRVPELVNVVQDLVDRRLTYPAAQVSAKLAAVT